MTFAVSGAGGFIGNHLVRAIEATDTPVVAFVRPGRPVSFGSSVQTVFLDLAAGVPAESLKDVDVVFHCAGQVRPARGTATYWRNNVLATRNLLEAAASASVKRFVHFSSVAVHGEDRDHIGATEDAPFATPPSDPYVATKIEAERTVQGYRGTGGMQVTILRPGWVWGPGDPGMLRIATQLRRGFFLIPGRGTNRLHITYVENLVRAALLASQTRAAADETFLVHDDASLTMARFMAWFAEALGVRVRWLRIPPWLALRGAAFVSAASGMLGLPPSLTRYEIAILVYEQGFSVEKAKRILDLRPWVAVEEGLRKTSRWVLSEWMVREPRVGGRAAITRL